MMNNPKDKLEKLKTLIPRYGIEMKIKEIKQDMVPNLPNIH